MVDDGEAVDDWGLSPVHSRTRLLVVLDQQELAVFSAKVAEMGINLAFNQLLVGARVDDDASNVRDIVELVIASVYGSPFEISVEVFFDQVGYFRRLSCLSEAAYFHLHVDYASQSPSCCLTLA